MIKIFDNSVISSVGRDIISVDVLKRISSNYDIGITNAVVTECTKYECGKLLPLISGMTILNVEDNRFLKIKEHLLSRYMRMGCGEVESIAASILLSADGVENYVIIDDSEARKIAERISGDPYIDDILGMKTMPVKYTGTIGLVKHLSDKGILSKEETKQIAYDLQDSSFRITEELLNLLR